MRTKSLLRKAIGAAVALASVASVSTSIFAADWPQWRGPNRDGVSAEKGWMTKWPEKGPKVLWKAYVHGGYSSFAVVGGRVYTMGNALDKPGPDGKYKKDEEGRALGSDIIWCLDAETGNVLWKHSYPAPAEGTQSTPAVYDGRVYTLGRFGQICCLDAADGRPIWSKNLLSDFGGKLRPYSGYACSPLVVQNVVIVGGGGEAQVLALDRKTGHLAWKSGPGAGAAESSPVPYDAGGKPGVVMLTPKVALGVDATAGKELWRYPWKWPAVRACATPVVHGDRVFFSGAGQYPLGVVLQLPPSGPKEVWTSREMGISFHTGVQVDGYLYGPHSASDNVEDTTFRCVSWATGEVKWKKEGLGLAPAISADGKLILTTDDGSLVVAEASPNGYKELARAKVMDGGYGQCWICPVLCDGRLYTRQHWGKLLCLDVKGP
jgi:outer membrane protein assembly factor BamB